MQKVEGLLAGYGVEFSDKEWWYMPEEEDPMILIRLSLQIEGTGKILNFDRWLIEGLGRRRPLASAYAAGDPRL